MHKGTVQLRKFLFLICFFSLTTAAQGEACMDALRDRAMAVEMKEYELMIISADNVIQRCEWRVGRNYGRLVADKILANAMLGRYAEGLKNADACLKNYPGTFADRGCRYLCPTTNSDGTVYTWVCSHSDGEEYRDFRQKNGQLYFVGSEVL